MRRLPGASAGGNIQRACARVVTAGAGTSLQHVARDAGAPVSGEARALRQRSPDRNPDDARVERIKKAFHVNRSRSRRSWLSIRGRIPTRVQELYGANTRPMEKVRGIFES